MNEVVLLAVPKGVATLRGPLVAVEGTMAVIWVFESTVNEVASVALNFTEVAPPRFVPVRTTDAPGAAVAGAKEAMAGVPSPVRTVRVATEDVALAPSVSVATAVSE